MSTLTAAQRAVLKRAKEAPAIVIFLIFVSEIGLNWLFVNFLYGAFSVPSTLTDGLIQPLFVLSLLKVAFIILGVVVWIGKFRSFQLGATLTDFKIGLISTFFFWSLLQLIFIAIGSISPGGITFLTGQTGTNPLLVLGTFVLFAFSKALYDEVIYRSLVLPQFLIKVRRFIDLPPAATLTITIVLSQVIYLIIQMPLVSLVNTETNLSLSFLSLFLLSLLNAVVYFRTRNIFICVGIHTLWFYPLFVVNTSIPQEYMLVAIGLGLIALWPLLPKEARVHQKRPAPSQRLW